MSIPMTKQVQSCNSSNVEEEAFNYDGYHIVRGEFLSHSSEPSITFDNYRFVVNTVCVNKLPEADYVQILIHSNDMKLAIKPCRENDKDSFRWCSFSNNKGRKRPKQIICRIFFAKIIELTGWNPDYRYKVMGKLIKSNEEYLFVFDLKAAEEYIRVCADGEKTKVLRTPIFPLEWKNQFGMSVEEHRKLLQVNFFNEYTIFRLENFQSLEKDLSVGKEGDE